MATAYPDNLAFLLSLAGMQTWIIMVDKKEYTLRRAWELPDFRMVENDVILNPSTDRGRKLISPPTYYLTLCNIINWHIVVKATNRSLSNPQSSHVAVRTPPHRQPVSCNGFIAGKMMKQRKLCYMLHLSPLENWVWQFSFTTVPIIHVLFIDLPFASSRIIYISRSFTGQILSLSATLFHTFWNLTNIYCKTILNI